MAKKKKERIELQLDPEKDADLIQFIDDNGTTRAGFIKFALRHYMNSFQGVNTITTPRQEKEESPGTSKPKKTKKKIPKLGQSFSSNDFE